MNLLMMSYGSGDIYFFISGLAMGIAIVGVVALIRLSAKTSRLRRERLSLLDSAKNLKEEE
jgi:hypothetical protein